MISTPYGGEGFVSALASETDKLTACVHCGLCLSSCPTYIELGDENDSPRGRLYLMRAAAEGRIEIGNGFERHIDLCLGCRACETVCPSGVRYGYLLERAREQIRAASHRAPGVVDRLSRFLLRHVFTSPGRLHWLFAPGRWLRNWSVVRMLGGPSGSRMASSPIQKALSLLRSTVPIILRSPSSPHAEDTRQQPTGSEPSRGTVELFAGCVMREMFDHVNAASRKVLSAHGWINSYKPDQVCCGALHAHSGDLETARQLARKNLDLFESGGHSDPIIVNSAGCGAMLKQYGELLESDARYHVRARRFGARVRDICEFLADTGFNPGRRPIPLRVTYDAPCHLHHGQGVKSAPVELIRQLPGICFTPLPQSDYCCGSAGIYNLLHPELADQILDRKLDHVARTSPDLIVTGNPGCLMHIASGVDRRGMAARVAHPIELIAASYD